MSDNDLVVPISIQAPSKGCRLWQVMRFGMVVALCPSEFWALDVASAMIKQYYEQSQNSKRETA